MAERSALQLDWAGRLLSTLRDQLLDGTLDSEKKRKFVEALVSSITVRSDATASAVFGFDGGFTRQREYMRNRAVREVSEERHEHARRYQTYVSLE
jgi:hypothetical protein